MVRNNKGPTIVRANGFQEWYNNNLQLDRKDGPAIVCRSGYICWYDNGLCHRISGPASEYELVSSWYLWDCCYYIEFSNQDIHSLGFNIGLYGLNLDAYIWFKQNVERCDNWTDELLVEFRIKFCS